ncbi:MAG: hypothetical protein P8X98_09040, partial [Woeseiaceae bacterium]
TIHGVGLKSTGPGPQPTRGTNTMAMVIVISLGVLAIAIIGQQKASMRQLQRVRMEKDQRSNR